MSKLDLERVRQAVREAGSLRAFAAAVGVEHSTIRRLLAGRIADPGLDLVCRIAKAAGCEVGDLVEPTRDGDLRAALRGAGISQAEAARRLGLPASTLSEMLRGRRPLPREVELSLRRLVGSRSRSRWADQEQERRERLETAMREPLPLEVLEAFGLEDEPFAAVDFSPAALLPTRDYRFAWRNLLRAAEARDFVIVCGPVGVGKTHLLHAALAELRKRERFVVCRVHATETDRLTTYAITEAILSEFGVASVPTRVERRAQLLERVLRENDRLEKAAILVVDEAHDLGVGHLRQLKRFHEVVSDQRESERVRPVLGVILVGQLPLERKLRRNPYLREVTWRASCIRLNGLHGEVRDYLRHKLQRVGGSITTWEKAATDELERRTVIPLEVNVVAAKAMVLAYDQRAVRGKLLVTAGDVREAIERVL